MIDSANLKTIDIELGGLIKARQINKIMSDADIKEYVYAFVYKTTIMKFGESHTWNPKTYGERLYRQAWHIPGWPTVAQSRSGDDMLDIIKHFPGINKADVWIRVWDMTYYPKTIANDPAYDVKALERQFLKEYEDQHGAIPVGNIKNEAHMDKPSVSDKTFSAFFDF